MMSSRAFQLILFTGLALRCLLFLVLSPYNPDDHFVIMRHVIEHGVFPKAELYTQAYHPPLYYLLSLPLAWFQSAKVAQVLSLALSCSTLWLIARFLQETPFLKTPRARCAGLALAAFQPQFVLYGLFISNDTLAFFLGAALILTLGRYLQNPHLRLALLLSLICGLGVATKGTFLSVLPIVPLVLVLAHRRTAKPITNLLAALTLLSLATLAGGAWRFSTNYRDYDRLVVHGMDFKPGWMKNQSGTWQGPGTLLDTNIAKLLRKPHLSAETRHSVPLLLFATGWINYMKNESSFNAAHDHQWLWLPRSVLTAGLFLTALITISACIALRRSVQSPELVLLLLMPVTAIALVVMVGLKYDAWSCFHTRLSFHTFPVFCLLLGLALDKFKSRFVSGLTAVALLICLASLLVETVSDLASPAWREHTMHLLKNKLGAP